MFWFWFGSECSEPVSSTLANVDVLFLENFICVV